MTATALVTAAIARIEQADEALRFLAAERFTAALDEAAAQDRSGRTGPFAGMPVLVKDLHDVAGMPTRAGSLLLQAAPAATSSAPSVERLVRSGAIVVGKTTLPEFAIEGYTANLLEGATANPWDTALSPGGSSGGSAAALASGSVPLATATDGGGSARIPAACCGLLGLKPTTGLIGRWPTPDWMTLSTDGVMATTATLLEAHLRVIAGPVAGDLLAPSSAAVAATLATRLPERPRLIAMARTSDLGDLPASVARAFDEAVATVEGLLATSATWRLPGSLGFEGDPDLDWFTLAAPEHLASIAALGVDDPDAPLHPASRAFFDPAHDIDLAGYLAAARRRSTTVRVIDELLGDDGLLLTPTLISEGFAPDGRLQPDDALGGLPPAVYNTALENMTGSPAISLPAGLLDSGLPFGLQVVAPRWCDGWLLELARRWETAHPWPSVAPGYSPFPGASA